MRATVTALAALVGVPVLLVGVAAAVVTPLVLRGLDDVTFGLGPHTVGVRMTPDGHVLVDPAGGNGSFAAVVLRGSDGTVLWRADATGQSHPVSELRVGVAPQGFRDLVPLTGPLDPRASYVIELYVIHPPPEPAGATAYLIGGGTATFRPIDLRPNRA